jgi:hypothetical protein
MCIEVLGLLRTNTSVVKGVHTTPAAGRKQAGCKVTAEGMQTGGKQDAGGMQTGCKHDAGGAQPGSK